jgi:hypothetical protein
VDAAAGGNASLDGARAYRVGASAARHNGGLTLRDAAPRSERTSIMDWIPNLDATPLALVIMTASVLLSIIGLWVVARWVRRTNVHAQLDNGAIAGLIAATVGIFAIAAGLTAVAGWGNTADASGRVGQEAAAITVLYHTLGGYPEPFQGEAKARLTEYVHYVIDREWPMLEQGKVLGGGVDVLDSLQRQIFAFAPATEAQKVVHAEALSRYNRLIELRRARIQAAEETALPAALWVVVILLGAIAVGGCFLLRIDDFRMHAAITTYVAVPIALVLFFIAVTDRPFRGGITVSLAPYQGVLDHVIAPDVERRKREGVPR